MLNRITTLGKIAFSATVLSLIGTSNIASAKETTDQLKNILSALKATAQTNLQTRNAQLQQLTTVATSINNYDDKIKKSIETTLNLLSSADQPYTSASALCNLPKNTATEEACEQNASKIAYQQEYALDPSFTRYILNFIPPLENQNGRNLGNPSIDNLNQLNFAALFFTNKPQTLFINQLASPYEFNQQWLTKSTQSNPGNKNASTRISPLLPPSTIAKVTDPKNLDQIKYQKALKAILLYEAGYKSSLATRSVAISILENLAQERAGKDSPLFQQSKIIKEITRKSWTDTMNNASPISLQKAQLLVLTQIAKQQFQAHLDNERNTALLSTMLLKMNEVADSSKQFQLKQSLEKMLKQIK